MSRINVLWVQDHCCYDGSFHGGGRLIWNVVPRFDPNQFHILPCVIRADEPVRKAFAKSPVPVRILDKGRFDPTTLWTFLRLIRKENIHVMHLHCYGTSMFGRFASLVSGVPTVIHDYDTDVYFAYPWYLGIMDRMLAPRTGKAIAASPMVKDFFVRKRKVDPERVHTMLHAIPMDKYNPIRPEKVQKLREQLGAASSTRIVATVTKLGPQRGNEYLLKTAAEVLKAFPNVLFLVVYKPTHFHRPPEPKYVAPSRVHDESRVSDLKALARGLGIEENVRFIDRLEDSDEWVSACDFIVAPFLSERFSSVHLLEAMARGKPIVATDMGEQREIIQDGVNGYLVSPGDVKDLAERILEVLADPGQLDRMSRQARAKSEQYSVDMYVQRLQRLYQELATHGVAGN